MKKKHFYTLLCFMIALFYSCTEASKPVEQKAIQQETGKTDFVFSAKADTVIENGEYTTRYKNGVLEMTGQMKNGKREGLWKSYYMDGSMWSETTFKDGKKNGKTSSWFKNKNKRYEGFYTNDKESGEWVFWDESGKQQIKQYD